MAESSLAGVNSSSKQAISIIALEIDSQVFYMPQSDLMTFENRQSLKQQSGEEKSVAMMEIANHQCPVYCLSADFELLNHIPDERSVCIVTAYNNQRLGLLCDKIHKLEFEQIRIENIPVCMKSKNTPISRLFLYRDEAGLVDLGMMLRNDSLIKYLNVCENEVA